MTPELLFEYIMAVGTAGIILLLAAAWLGLFDKDGDK